jgi:flagellar motor switch protein FliN/FliY
MKKNNNVPIETVAELFAAAFAAEGVLKASDSCGIEQVPTMWGETEKNVFWFKQTFAGLPNLDLFVGISRETQEILFGRAAARESSYEDQAPQLRDHLEKTFHAFARTLSTAVGTAISCVSFIEEAPQPTTRTISLIFREDEATVKIILGVTEAALNSLLLRFPFGGAADSAQANRRAASFEPSRLGVLMNINLPVSISFGAVEMMLGDVLKLATGSIVELDHLLNEPINVVVNNCLIARGEVVVADGNYAIRVSEVVSPGPSV